MRKSCYAIAIALAVGLSLAPLRAQAPGQPTTASATRELVVVLHGMGRTSRSMQPMATALEEAGFDVVNIAYSSLCCTIAELGAAVQRELEAHRGPLHTVVHFVGHSLGGIIVRWILVQRSPPAGVGRVVLLATPNQGSRSADRFTTFLGWLYEPLHELRTDSTSTVRTLGRIADIPIGVIAGRHDAKVSPEETHLAEETAHVLVDGTHAFLMGRAEVQRLTIGFLRTGQFDLPTTARR